MIVGITTVKVKPHSIVVFVIDVEIQTYHNLLAIHELKYSRVFVFYFRLQRKTWSNNKGEGSRGKKIIRELKEFPSSKLGLGHQELVLNVL